MRLREAEKIRQDALELIDSANKCSNVGDAAVLAQQASAMATLAVAAELGDLRDSVLGVKSALGDQDGYGAAGHLRFISDWLGRRSPTDLGKRAGGLEACGSDGASAVAPGRWVDMTSRDPWLPPAWASRQHQRSAAYSSS
ncbi:MULTISPECIES: hypothetical protein [unclassified Actinoplanes]|uniref:hypothetical protein n=1 Tax=unclassified Actinoplanes TaxID=2626549 RepID=UPI001E616CB8|nr:MULTISPECIES: hypothetical protein [unclassified Actinoplanes]